MTGLAYAAVENGSSSNSATPFILLLVIFLIGYLFYKKNRKVSSNVQDAPTTNPELSNFGTGWRLDRVLMSIGALALLLSPSKSSVVAFMLLLFILLKGKKYFNAKEKLTSVPIFYNLGRAWRRLDMVLISIGLITLLLSLFMDTSVETTSGRINNIGLMKDQQNYLLVSVVILIIGVMLRVASSNENSASTPENSADKSDTKICPYCAETIKVKATICRFCNKSQSP